MLFRSKQKIQAAIEGIRREYDERVAWFEANDKLLEAQRLTQRTKYDLEMLEQTGFVKGIENYSRYLTNREPGEQPATLLDYFPDDFLMMIEMVWGVPLMQQNSLKSAGRSKTRVRKT